MRENLSPYRGPEVLNFLCIVATEILGQNHIRNIPALVSGFDSISNCLPNKTAKALSNLRLVGYAPATIRELRLMVENYRAHNKKKRLLNALMLHLTIPNLNLVLVI